MVHGKNIPGFDLDAEDHKPASPFLKTGRNQGNCMLQLQG